MNKPSIFVAAVLACASPTPSLAQSVHDHASMHPTSPVQNLLLEPGQGAFAAISEIVALLLADPATDWSSVDINALRQHLVDMDYLITQAQVQTTQIENGLEFQITLTGVGGGAAERMVPAHAPVLGAETSWASVVSRTDNMLVWRVTDMAAVDTIRALGFYGLMAVGDHHRAHHLGMATGEMVH